MGYSPSVRLFEAAACGSPIISDWWAGLNTIFVPGKHVLVAKSGKDVLSYLRDLSDEERRWLAIRASEHVLAHHTAAHRAITLEGYVEEVLVGTATRRAAVAG
jgi:spore maturation protein CgeB